MGTTITVTSRGVLTLPVRLRKELGLTGDDLLIAEMTPDGLLLRPAVALPVEIYTDDRVAEFKAEEDALTEFLATRVSRSGRPRAAGAAKPRKSRDGDETSPPRSSRSKR